LERVGDLLDLVVEALFGHGGRTACRARGAVPAMPGEYRVLLPGPVPGR
jgi:hypothetical protein